MGPILAGAWSSWLLPFLKACAHNSIPVLVQTRLLRPLKVLFPSSPFYFVVIFSDIQPPLYVFALKDAPQATFFSIPPVGPSSFTFSLGLRTSGVLAIKPPAQHSPFELGPPPFRHGCPVLFPSFPSFFLSPVTPFCFRILKVESEHQPF